jgi:uncharacterized protein (TIGR03382 family)
MGARSRRSIAHNRFDRAAPPSVPSAQPLAIAVNLRHSCSAPGACAPVDAGVDGGNIGAPSKGCKCDVGGRGEPSLVPILLVAAAVLLARRRYV